MEHESKCLQLHRPIMGPTFHRQVHYDGNHKMSKIQHQILDPLSIGVDALLQVDWSRENNYLNPQERLLNKVLDIVCQQQAVATVIAPEWKAQWFCQKLKHKSVAGPKKYTRPQSIVYK